MRSRGRDGFGSTMRCGSISPGDTITIRPGQQHKLWADGEEDLVLVVTCAPVYDVSEVEWDE